MSRQRINFGQAALHPKTYAPAGMFGPKETYESRLAKKIQKTREKLLAMGSGEDRAAVLKRLRKLEGEATGKKFIAKKQDTKIFKLRHKYHL